LNIQKNARHKKARDSILTGEQMKSLSSMFLMGLLVSGFVLVCNVNFGAAQDSTEVGGIIDSDTTWTIENSPYVAESPLLVNSSVTLTIEPGVTVYLINTYMRINGTLNARGTTENPIFLICNGTELGAFLSTIPAIQFSSESISWDEQTGLGSIIENAVVSSTHNSHTIYVDNTAPKINNCTVINSADARAIYLESGAAIVSNCSITAGDSMPGISCGSASLTGNDAQILNNIITNCGAGIAIYAGSPVVEGNLIANNTGSKSAGLGGIRVAGYTASPTIRNNTIVGNSVGFNIWDSPSPTIAFNNILDNIEYNAYLKDSGTNINAAYNWWGTTDVSSINQSIHDAKNDFNLGVVGFVPFLTELNPDTPTLPITVDFEYSPVVVYANVEADFDTTASFGEYSSIVEYTWNFGDGTITTTESPTIKHTYTAPNSYNVTLTVTDEFGFTNSTATSVVVLQDDVPPVTVDNYDGLWRTADFTINLTATDHESGVAETYYRINDEATKTVSTNGQPLIITEGVNNILEYWSTDNAGNEETPKTVTGIKLDKTPPTSLINLTGTIGNDGWFISDVTVSISATDSVSEVDKIEYSFDNSIWNTYVAPFTIADEGILSIYYRAIDKAGNVEMAKTETGKLDKTVPFGSVLINENADYTNSMSVTLTLSADDTTSGVAQMCFSNDETEWSSWETYSTSKTWTLTADNVEKTVYVQFKDNADLVSKSYQDSIILDTTKPIGDAGQDQTVNVNTTITFDASASSDNVGIVSYEWDFGDGATGTGETTTHTYDNAGTYTVSLTVKDAAGNVGTHQITVTVMVPEEFPLWTTGVAAAVIVTVAAVTVFLWKRRK